MVLVCFLAVGIGFVIYFFSTINDSSPSPSPSPTPPTPSPTPSPPSPSPTPSPPSPPSNTNKIKTKKRKMQKQTVNLIYFKDNQSTHGNFGDELSKFITEKLINPNKYKLVYNEKNISLNIICIGSYIHQAVNNCYIFGSGVRTQNNIERGHHYETLHVHAVRGPLTEEFLKKEKKISLHDNTIVYGDPALLLPRFYQPNIQSNLRDKIGLVPHKSNYCKYVHKIDHSSIFFVINPTDPWEKVIDSIASCHSIVSSSLHGLICADAYHIPNLWLDEYKLTEGDFKFKDYFLSQKRDYVKISSLKEYDPSLLYDKGNSIDLNVLEDAFPFS